MIVDGGYVIDICFICFELVELGVVSVFFFCCVEFVDVEVFVGCVIDGVVVCYCVFE